MKSALRLSAVAAALAAAHPAAGVTTIHTFNGLGLAVPDGNPSGLANLQNVSSPGITTITSVKVTVDISGTFNGDLYAYLQHSGGLAVLLNRSGRTAGNAFGYDDDGFNVTFDDLATNNVHTYRDQVNPTAGNPLTGTWQPDARAVDPDLVVDTDPPTATLAAAFNGKNANGDWTLFVADLSGGSAHTLNGWSLEITGIPEPSGAVLLGFGLAALAVRRRR